MKDKPRKRPPITNLIDEINALDSTSREKFAQKCGTSVGNLRQIAYGFGGVSPKLAKSIIANSNCDISIEQLIPELSWPKAKPPSGSDLGARMLKLYNKRVNYMKNFHKNQPPCPPIVQFLRTVGIWLYSHAVTIDTCVKNTLDVICLFIGFIMFYILLLIGVQCEQFWKTPTPKFWIH